MVAFSLVEIWIVAVSDTFTLNSPEHGSGKKRSHPAYL
jgi:hypothetical protein